MNGPDDHPLPRHPSVGFWLAAALVATVLHAGALAAVMVDRQPEASDAVGAPASEIAIELASPRAEPTALPPGPEAEASAASPAVVEQKAVVEESRLPQDVPTDTEEPDRLVARQPTETPKEETPTPVEAQASPSQEAVASEATAPPVVEAARDAPRATAPVQGTGASDARVRATWQRQLVTHLDRSKRYPSGAARRSSEVVVSFTLDRIGRVVAASVAKSSGDPAFDEAALAMMRRADPVPQPPPTVADEGLTFTVPVVFRARGRG